ncbi:uncharacterized protein EI90DRAFT_3091110 [Cantharellus anzutake]|uniref:uncharacterized protein n=1 Tax=Cantharellus anzutake TaxID=1750568 RepID=UPI001906F8B1|nr:uncharacterized protein EI90DRAFT_3091110 [Cantharellus anzutake]KAF8313967.1 hypothetical protein EI90DRAFT_3091110 [Cantharellus anzutake]
MNMVLVLVQYMVLISGDAIMKQRNYALLKLDSNDVQNLEIGRFKSTLNATQVVCRMHHRGRQVSILLGSPAESVQVQVTCMFLFGSECTVPPVARLKAGDQKLQNSDQACVTYSQIETTTL